MTLLSDLTDQQIEDAIREHGSKAAAANALKVARTTFSDEARRRGIGVPSPGSLVNPIVAIAQPSPRMKRSGTLTRETLHAALQPPNTCRVKAFRDGLNPEEREVFDEALSYDNRDFSARQLREWLTSVGFSDDIVPGEDPIKDHRAGRRPCRCRG